MTQHAVVTGGSRNIGADIARRFKQAGYQVIVVDRVEPEHAEYDVFVPVDLTEPASAASALQNAVSGKTVTRFVHNAGIGKFDLAEDVQLSDVEMMFRVSVQSLISLGQVVIPGMRQEKFGRIVAIGSVVARGRVGRTGYAASKAALSGVVRTWALELGEDGITVNIVSPGPIRTSLFDEGNPPDHPSTKAMVAAIPMGRIGRPADVAHAVAFLCSDDAGYVTGQDLAVCGGTSILGIGAPGRTGASKDQD